MSRLPLLLLLVMTTSPSDPGLLGASADEWLVVNDAVMGGLSRGRVEIDDGVLVFSGTVSLANDGGFSSIRRNLEAGLEGRTGLRLTVRGDGRRYQVRLAHDRGFGGGAWRAAFTAPEEWTEIDVPFAAFEPTFRGRPMPSAGPIRPADLRRIGFLLGDETAGPFRLEVRSASAYRSAETG